MSRIQFIILTLLFGSLMTMALPGFGMTVKRAGREKRSDMIFEAAELNPPDIMELESDTVTSGPRNAVLLLITETAQDREDLWKDFKALHSFPVEGSLQSCYHNELDSTRFSLNNGLISGNEECDCEHFLRSNVGNMLSWARNIGEMATGAVSGTNFSAQSSSGHDSPMGTAKEFEELEQNSVKPEVGKTKVEMHGDWHPIDLGKPTTRISSFMVPPNGKENGDNESMWDVFETFSRIRIALFRTLMDSLGGNMAASEDPSFPEKSYPSQSNFVDMVGTAIRVLKSTPNGKGYVLVVAASGNQLASAVELLQREISRDTLLVVAGTCTHGGKPVPFFGQGPSANMLQEAKTIWDLPTILRNVVATGHRGSRIRRHHGPQFPGSTVAGPKMNQLHTGAKKRMPRHEAMVKQSSKPTTVENRTSEEMKSSSLAEIVNRTAKSEIPNVEKVTVSNGEMSSSAAPKNLDQSTKSEIPKVEKVTVSSGEMSSSAASKNLDQSAKSEIPTVEKVTVSSGEMSNSAASKNLDQSAKSEIPNVEKVTVSSGEMSSSSASKNLDQSSKSEIPNVEKVTVSNGEISTYSSMASRILERSAKSETTVMETTPPSEEIKASSLSKIISRRAKDETTSGENTPASGEMRSSSASEIAAGKLSTVLGTVISVLAMATLGST